MVCTNAASSKPSDIIYCTEYIFLDNNSCALPAFAKSSAVPLCEQNRRMMEDWAPRWLSESSVGKLVLDQKIK